MKPLTERQRKILEWIRDGAPEREWPDYSHRTSAKVLQSRGLTKVRGHGASWTAEITELGRRYLAGKPETDTSAPRQRAVNIERRGRGSGARPSSTSSEPERERLTGSALLDRVVEAGGTLTISDPPEGVRAAYRSALSLIPRNDVPAGKRVSYTGRDRGDLVIRLVDSPEPVEPDRPVPVPETVDTELQVIRELAEDLGAMEVSEPMRSRALLVMQAIVEEGVRRGHETRRRAEGPGIEVVIDGEAIPVVIAEEKEKVTKVPDEAVAKLKYDWQRVPPVTMLDWNGRLSLSIDVEDRWSPGPWWADRKRWTLESRLPQIIRAVEDLAKQRRGAKERAERERQARRRLWEESVPKARRAYVDDLNRRRLGKQIEKYAEARALRSFADAVAARASGLDDPNQREVVLAWAAWIHAEADRVDPAGSLNALGYATPEDIPAWHLDEYMPKGMSASRPPD